jgi:catechol 2,3-dioxygenase-like lactoylglutathione lyase family enzyme
MTDPNFVILYVKDPSASAAFYADVLGRAPVEASPTLRCSRCRRGYARFVWANVAPAADVAAGGAELAITVPDADAARAHAD